jgi:predicted deacylase
MQRCIMLRFFSLPGAFPRLGLSLLLLAAALGTSPAVAAVRETCGVLNKGTRWETPYYIQQSDQAGPTVVVVGGVHGDEPAGAAAAEQIRHWPIVRGTLAVLPRVNPPGLAANTRLMPGVEKNLANLNRNYPKAGHSGPAVGEPAPAIWNWVQSLKPDWVLDLHEGTGIRGAGSTSVGSSTIVFPSPAADEAAKLMLAAVNATIDVPEKKFVHLGPPVDGSLSRAAGEHLHAQAMTVETSIHDLPAPTAAKASPAKGNESPAKRSEERRVGKECTG